MCMQHFGSGLSDFMLSCKFMLAEHSCINDMIIKPKFIALFMSRSSEERTASLDKMCRRYN